MIKNSISKNINIDSVHHNFLRTFIQIVTTDNTFVLAANSGIGGNVFDFTSATPGVWDFGDGTVITSSSGSHTYFSHGSYTVTFDGTLVTTANVIAQPLPTVSILMSTANPATNEVTLTASSDFVSYDWLVDGVSYSTKSLTHVFSAAGDYVISLVVTDINGNANRVDITLPVLMPNVLPIGSFNYVKNLLSVDFTRTGVSDPDGSDANLTYLWDFGDGTTDTSPDTTHIYPSPTTANDPAGQTFTATLTITDERGGSTSVAKTFTVYDFAAYGPELMVNPDFTTADISDFIQASATAAINGFNELIITSNDGSQDRVDFAKTLVVGTQYELLITAKNLTSTTGAIKNLVGTDASVSIALTSTYAPYSIVFTATSTAVLGRIYATGSGVAGQTVSVSSINLREIL